MPFSIGECIDGRYEIRALLRKGGMAEVYRAVDNTTGSDVVLKLPHVAIIGDMTAFSRYQREIEIARGLDHPGLQRLLPQSNTRYMVLDYVEGEAVIYRALRRKPAERYASMAALEQDLQHLDGVVLPEKYERGEPPPPPPGDLPPWRTTVPILAVVLALLLAFGFAAELLHRNLTPR
jgi:hypothetical protein